jgi:hypothetical protein
LQLRKSKQSWNVYKEYLFCNVETVIKSESSFEARKARTIDRTIDSVVPEMGTIPYYARPELTQNISNHICIKESKSRRRRRKNWSHLWTTFWSWRYFKPCRICLV